VFDEISYSKGGSVIRMIAAFLGQDTFREGLRQYLKTHEVRATSPLVQHRPADRICVSPNSTATRQRATCGRPWPRRPASLSRCACAPILSDPCVADCGPQAIMASWTSQTGMPVLSVHAAPGGKLRVTQQRFLADGVVAGGPTWIVPVTALASDGTLVDFRLETAEVWTVSVCVSMLYVPDAVQADLPIAVPAGGWVKLNVEQAGFYRVHYADAAVADPLVAALKTGTLTNAMDRFGIVSDAFALAQAKQLSAADMLKLLEGCSGDDAYIVLRSVQSALSRVLRVFFGCVLPPPLPSLAPCGHCWLMCVVCSACPSLRRCSTLARAFCGRRCGGWAGPWRRARTTSARCCAPSVRLPGVQSGMV
jgi:hypothetical protein